MFREAVVLIGKTTKNKVLAGLLGLLTLFVLIIGYADRSASVINTFSVCGIGLSETRPSLIGKYGLLPNQSAASEGLIFKTKSGSPSVTFSGEAIYSIEGESLTGKNFQLSRGDTRSVVQKSMGQPNLISPVPMYGQSFSEETYNLRSSAGVPCVTLVVLYEGDLVRNFTLIRLSRAIKLWLSQII